MKTIKHHAFTLWVFSEDCDADRVPALIFDEATSFDEIALIMLSLDELGIQCSLTCETWNQVISDDCEDFVK